MLKRNQLIFAFIAGSIFGLCGGIAVHDFSLAAHAGEPAACRDEPDRAAWMGRRPGEAHSVETCIHIMRFGNPRWVPELGHPLQPAKREPDAAWLREALDQLERGGK